MIIERHKCSPELAKALDATKTKDSGGLSHYATLELPEADLIIEGKKQNKGPNEISVIIAVAMNLYGGSRTPDFND